MKKILSIIALLIISLGSYAVPKRTPAQIGAEVMKGLAQKDYMVLYNLCSKKTVEKLVNSIKAKMEYALQHADNEEGKKKITFYLQLLKQGKMKEYFAIVNEVLPPNLSNQFANLKYKATAEKGNDRILLFSNGVKDFQLKLVLEDGEWKAEF